MTRLDGNLMKSIAMLGMVFLPATFVSVSLLALFPSNSNSRRRSSPWDFSSGLVKTGNEPRYCRHISGFMSLLLLA